MKRSRFTEVQIIGILKEHKAGVSVADLCRKHGVSDATVFNGRPSMAAWTSARRIGLEASRTRTRA